MANNQEPVKFSIRLNMPIGLTPDLGPSLTIHEPVPWHISELDIRRIEDNVFDLTLSIADEIKPDFPHNKLVEFRDQLVSLIAFTATVPVRLVSMGCFTFPLGNRKYQALSLGFTKMVFPPTMLPTVRSIVEGLALPAKYTAALHFFLQALNDDDPVNRFINLAICCELLIGEDSPIKASKHPSCGNPRCSYALQQCPQCQREWKIPVSLKEKASFLFPDSDLLDRFAATRNRVFHGSSSRLLMEQKTELYHLNVRLLKTVRDYIGAKLDLPPIDIKSLSWAVNPPDVAMSIFYTVPEAAQE